MVFHTLVVFLISPTLLRDFRLIPKIFFTSKKYKNHTTPTLPCSYLLHRITIPSKIVNPTFKQEDWHSRPKYHNKKRQEIFIKNKSCLFNFMSYPYLKPYRHSEINHKSGQVVRHSILPIVNIRNPIIRIYILDIK